jgi:DNA repair protein RecO (recombination protein O)
MQPQELTQIKLNQDTRRTLLHAYQTYYALHIQDFGVMKTLPVLQEVLG